MSRLPMKPIILLSLRLLAALACMTAAAARADFAYSQTFTVNQAIPDFTDAGAGELVNVQTVSLGGGTISDISVGLNIAPLSDTSPAYAGDYYAAIGHDDGYAVLLNRIGKTAANPFGSGQDGVNVTFADTAANGDIHAAPDAPATLTGAWAPDGRETDPDNVVDIDARTATLSSFVNPVTPVSTDGQWRVFVADDSAGGTGTLVSWTLNLQVATTTAAPITIAANATATFSTPQTVSAPLVVQGVVIGPSNPGQAVTFTGAISGAGSFRGNFIFNGSYSPGNSPAATIIDGDATFAAGNTLIIELGGTTPGTGYDTINVTGTLTLGGTLNIVLINGYTPAPGDTFQFLTATSIGGTFSQVNLPAGFAAIGDILHGGSFSLAAIPEPATAASLAALAALGVVAWRRRRR